MGIGILGKLSKKKKRGKGRKSKAYTFFRQWGAGTDRVAKLGNETVD